MIERECPTCDGTGEAWTGRREHDTNAPVMAECRDCWGTGYECGVPA